MKKICLFILSLSLICILSCSQGKKLNSATYTVIEDPFVSKKDRSSLFASFKKEFPRVAVPYTVIQPNHLFKKEAVLSYHYHVFIPGMIDPRYSREAIDEFSPVAVLASTGNYTLLLYVSRVQFMDTITSVTLASFDPKGNLLDTLVFASSDTKDFMSGTINADYKIKVLCFNKIWKNDPFEEGFENNYIIRRELVETRLYELDKTGFFYRKGIIKEQNTTAVKD